MLTIVFRFWAEQLIETKMMRSKKTGFIYYCKVNY